MFHHIAWRIDHTKILTRRELGAVIANLQNRTMKSANARLTLTIMRLACCCGLRVSEIAALRLDDVRVGLDRPHLRIRREIAKGQRARNVALWWDAGTLADITGWKREREEYGASGEDLLVCSLMSHRRGQALSRHALRLRFQRACSVLGTERVQNLTIHHGRHTFVSHALAGGRSLAEVRDATGHSSVAITSVYLHVVVDDDATVGRLFAFDAEAR
jgi:integrase